MRKPRTKIAPWIKDLVQGQAIRHPEFTAGQIVYQLKDRQKASGNRDPLPGIRAIQKIMKAIRGKNDPLDSPWSMAAQKPYSSMIPPDSLPRVRDIWLECLVRGEQLSVREAIWVSRLTFILRDARPSEVYYWARRYALRERAAEPDEPDTSDLDGCLLLKTKPRDPLLGFWLYKVAERFDLVDRFPMGYDAELDDIYALPSGVRDREVLKSRRQASLPAAGLDVERELQLTSTKTAFTALTAMSFAELRGGVPAVTQEPEMQNGLDPQNPEVNIIADYVYAALLRKISKNPKWKTSSAEERQELAGKLGLATLASAKARFEFFSHASPKIDELDKLMEPFLKPASKEET